MLFEGYARPYFRPLEWPRREPQPINWEDVLYTVGHPLVALYYKLTLNPDIVFHHPLPAGPKILVANHPSTTDPLILTTLCAEPVRILITESVFTIPVVGRLLRRTGQIPVAHDNGRAAFDEALRRLKDGQTVGIFPEGSLSPREGGLHGPRTGAARLALLTGAPIIPVGIHLDRARLRYGAKQLDERDEPIRWYWRGPYAMTVGQPFYLQGDIEDREGVHAAAERIMQAIRHLAGQSERRMREKPSRVPMGSTSHHISST
ncbi:MAG: lysophospholipid acyltransferase family protein [Anaerolineae bacterium]